MTAITTLIAEDEPLAAEALADWVRETPRLSLVAMCASGDEALEAIRRLRPSLVLLDIQMPGLTGLQVLRALREEGLDVAVILTTAYDEHALAAFELHAVDYLLKPFSRERFDEAVEHALKHRGLPPEEALTPAQDEGPLRRILVRDRGGIVPLAAEAIEYLQSDHKYTAIASRGRTFLVRLPVSAFEQRLDPQRFLRISRGCIVNLEFVESMAPNDTSQLEVLMRGGARFVASREVSRKLREQSL